MNLYLTADKIGAKTGGGLVTFHERKALQELGAPVITVALDHSLAIADPFLQDTELLRRVKAACEGVVPVLTHCYSGCLPETVKYLKSLGSVVTYTVAAHCRIASRKAHEELGIPFTYPHLTQEDRFQQYISGYRWADVIITPGTVPKKIIQDYGPEFASKRIEIIPHGCKLPNEVKPLPKQFVLGYLGAYAADKGVLDLLKAWGKLNYPDATLLLAGRDSTSGWVSNAVRLTEGGNFRLMGWVDEVSEFYNQISVLCQPSRTEGFGIEVLEAMAHGRSVICSDAAGAVDIVKDPNLPPGNWFKAGNIEDLVSTIHCFKSELDEDRSDNEGRGNYEKWREVAEKHTWDKIRERYKSLWRSLL